MQNVAEKCKFISMEKISRVHHPLRKYLHKMVESTTFCKLFYPELADFNFRNTIKMCQMPLKYLDPSSNNYPFRYFAAYSNEFGACMFVFSCLRNKDI